MSFCNDCPQSSGNSLSCIVRHLDAQREFDTVVYNGARFGEVGSSTHVEETLTVTKKKAASDVREKLEHAANKVMKNAHAPY